MKYAADLHIHSVLSPCADFLMGYKNIIENLKINGIKIFAITDHNDCGNSRIFQKKAQEEGLIFVPGIEIQTAEEIHVLGYFPKIENLEKFVAKLKMTLPQIKNKEEVFGYQLIIDEEDEYVAKEEAFLAGASSMGIDEICALISGYGGISVPAHLDRTNSVLSNLGYIPEINFAAYEIYKTDKIEDLSEKYQLKGIMSSSDAHVVSTLGKPKMEIEIEEESAEAVITAIKQGKVKILK